MPTDSDRRRNFLRRFNPLDLSTLTMDDLPLLRATLLSGELDRRYARFESRLITLVEAVRHLHRLERAASWQDRMDYLEMLGPRNCAWTAELLELTDGEAMRLRSAIETAMGAHELLKKSKGSHGLLRRERKCAWHALVRILAPALRRSIDDSLRAALLRQ